MSHGLTPLHIQAEPLLRAIVAAADAPKPASSNDLAAAVGRDGANTRKSLRSFEDEGLITRDPYTLTEEGRRVLAILDRAAGVAAPTDADANAVRLRHDQIVSDPDNARTHTGLTEESIAEMAAELLERGMLTPPKVRQRVDGLFVLMAGERRWRAWGRLIAEGTWSQDHLETCTTWSGQDEAEWIEAGLAENLHREDITNLEIAHNLEILHTRHGRSVAQLAKVSRKTERFVQIALKVARDATPEDKEAYARSETEYRAAKARGEVIKRAMTWEELRNRVVTPKHKAAMERKDRLLLMVAELALKASLDPHAVHLGPEGVMRIGPGATGLTEISVPPGGGHYSEAETLKLIEEHREDGRIYAGATDLAVAFLNEGGFATDPALYVSTLRAEIMGDLTDRMCVESGKYGTHFINPPKPPEAAAPPPEPIETRTADLQLDTPAKLEGPELSAEAALALAEAHYKAQVDGVVLNGGDQVALVTSGFKETDVGRELRFSHLMMSCHAAGLGEAVRLTSTGVRWLTDRKLNAMLHGEALTWARNSARLHPAPGDRFATPGLNTVEVEHRPSPTFTREEAAQAMAATDNDLVRGDRREAGAPDREAAQLALDTPGLKDAEFVALMELAHKITKHPVEARGGAIRGAMADAWFRGPGAPEANALVAKRLVAFVQAPPPSMGFIASLTPLGEEMAEGVDDARLHEVWSETWHAVSEATGVGEWVAFIQSGRYATAWLNTDAPDPLATAPAATKPAGPTEIQRQTMDAVRELAHAALAQIDEGPSHKTSGSHVFMIADDLMRALHGGDLVKTVTHLARLRAHAGAMGAGHEIGRAFRRLGVDHKTFHRAMDRDSPDYAKAHSDCHVVSADAHGMAMVARDPADPRDELYDEEASS